MTSFCFPVDLLRKRTLHYLLFAMNEHIFVVDNQFKFAEGAISKNMKSSVKLTTLQANNSIDVLLIAKTTYLRWRNINYSHQFIYAKCVQLYTNLVFLLYSFFYMRNGTGSKYECFQEKAATQDLSFNLFLLSCCKCSEYTIWKIVEKTYRRRLFLVTLLICCCLFMYGSFLMFSPIFGNLFSGSSCWLLR